MKSAARRCRWLQCSDSRGTLGWRRRRRVDPFVGRREARGGAADELRSPEASKLRARSKDSRRTGSVGSSWTRSRRPIAGAHQGGRDQALRLVRAATTAAPHRFSSSADAESMDPDDPRRRINARLTNSPSSDARQKRTRPSRASRPLHPGDEQRRHADQAQVDATASARKEPMQLPYAHGYPPQAAESRADIRRRFCG